MIYLVLYLHVTKTKMQKKILLFLNIQTRFRKVIVPNFGV